MADERIGDTCPCCGSGVMQYTQFVPHGETPDQGFIVAAPEASALFADEEPEFTIHDVDEHEACDYVVYGAFIPSNVMSDEDMVASIEDMTTRQVAFIEHDHLYLSITGTVNPFTPSGGRCPFAALLRTYLPIRGLEAPALTLFQHYANMGPVENIWSRPGVLAVKTGVAVPEGLSEEALSDFVLKAINDEEAAKEAAFKAFHIGVAHVEAEPNFSTGNVAPAPPFPQ